MKKRNRKRASAGFSLVEVVAAITVLGLVVAGVSTSLVSSIQFNARTEQRLQAELAVANAVERFRAVGYDGSSEPVGVDITIDERDYGGQDPIPANLFGYRLTITSELDDSIRISTYARAEGVGP